MRFKFKKQTLLACAKASQEAYNQTNRIHTVEDDGKLIIAFKGSASLEDWVEDLKFVKTRFGKSYVHSGFMAEWNKCKADFIEIFNKIDDKIVYLTGHSLGGALATLACASNINDNLPLITFAGPKVGDAAFVASLNSDAGILSQRVVLDNDPVCSNPCFAGYKHFDGKLHVSRSGKIIDTRDGFFGTLRDCFHFSNFKEHHIDWYVKAMDALES